MVKGIHRFTLEKYSLYKGIGEGGFFHSNCFTVGGLEWAIDGARQDKTNGGERYEQGHVYFDLHVSLKSKIDNGVPVCINMRLVDQSGNGVHWDSQNSVPRVITTGSNRGFCCFIDRQTTEITTIADSDFDDVDDDEEGDIDFLGMLSSGEGSDVVLNVGGDKYHAHKFILSARSSVFESIFSSHIRASDQQEMVIRDVEPGVFKALLHFVYSDTLPGNERSLVDGYAFGKSLSNTIGAKLLAAADKYDIKRLKSICESHLWRSISLSRFTEIISLAVKYNASELKHLCFKFAVDNYAGKQRFV
ncbi:hypothetical protein ACP275_09G004800 [Erythranthe tilingii]